MCEVCGREISGLAYLARIEGAELVVCQICVAHATWYRRLGRREMARRMAPPARAREAVRPQGVRRPSSTRVERAAKLEVIDDFGGRVREAREARGMTQEELGKLIGEKASVISRVEASKMEPDVLLARKLEHALGIKLLVEAEERASAPVRVAGPREGGLTLGDILLASERAKKRGEEH